jgi:hypothetical protein
MRREDKHLGLLAGVGPSWSDFAGKSTGSTLMPYMGFRRGDRFCGLFHNSPISTDYFHVTSVASFISFSTI